MINRCLLTVAALAAVLTTTSGCERRPGAEQPATSEQSPTDASPAPDPDALVLKTYKVSPGYATRLRPVLSTVMRHGDKTIGRVSFSPNGLLVVAPAGVHAGIAELVASLKDAGPKTPPTIEMSYWLVLGEPGKKTGGDSCGKLGLGCLDGGSDGHLSKALRPVIESGGIYVTQMKRLSMKTLESEDGQVSGAGAEVKQVASFSGDRIVANVRAWVKGYKEGALLDTRLQFAPNQTIVLGQVGYDPVRRGGDEAEPRDSNKIMFFVVRGAVHE